MNALILAARYLLFHWPRSLVLVLVTALILVVPVVSQAILAASQRTLTDRAEATPLLLGSRGSQLDLAMNALYFSADRAEPITMAAADAIWESGLGIAIPLHTAFESNGARIVGTSLDYLDFRGLIAADGRRFAVLGEALLGASVAERLGLGPGDSLISAPENLFDLDGIYPLEMSVVGVLAPAGTPDDEAIFVDVKTAWVIAGIGHGHDDVVTLDDTGEAVAPAAIQQFTRITEANIDSFHFHGDAADYPIAAVLVVPRDTRAATILRGRYLDPENPVQAVVPREVIGDLVDRIFRIKALLDLVAGLVGAAALAAIALALFLSWRLRAPEVATAVRIGAAPGMVVQLVAAEVAMIVVAALALAGAGVWLVLGRGEALVTWLVALNI